MKLKLIKKLDEAKGTKSFFWEPEREVDYLPGQYFYWTLPKLNYPDDRGPTRDFTLSSSPTEGSILRITTRIRPQSGFKKTLDELKVGSFIESEGPNGTFILDENGEGTHVFLAGGIGITPFRSMIKYAVDKGLTIPIHLIYSNSLPEEITFRKELTDWSKELPNFRLDMTITKPEESASWRKEPWRGLTGRIDENMLRSQFDIWHLSFAIADFWLCGPPAMVSAMEEVLSKLRVPESRIRSDKFTGY